MSTFLRNENPLVISNGNNQYQLNGVILPFITTDTTPTTPTELSVSLSNNNLVVMHVRLTCIDTATFSTVYETEVKNVFRRNSSGTSTRVGTANGMVIASTANQFGAPKPTITFGDPSVSNIATVILTGTNSSVTWYVVYDIHICS